MRLVILGMLFGLAASQAATVTVNIENGLQFVPSMVQVRPGDTVEFVNQSGAIHTVTADPSLVQNPLNVLLPLGAAPFNSGPLLHGKKFLHTFSVPGLYQYVCLPHETMGMQGQVDVVADFQRLDLADSDEAQP